MKTLSFNLKKAKKNILREQDSSNENAYLSVLKISMNDIGAAFKGKEGVVLK